MNHTYSDAHPHHHDTECCEHGHEHHHEHGHEHHHSAAERAVEGMFVLSKTRQLEGSVETAALVNLLRALFLSLAEKAAVDGLIPGHLKGVVKAPGGETLGVSVTRPDTVDFVPSAAWERLTVLDRYVLTVNVMLLAETDICEQDLFAGLT